MQEAEHHIVLNSISYPIIATRRKGSRRFVIRFDAKNQRVKLTLPKRGSLEQALKFTQSKKTWLELQQEKLGAQVTLKPGMIVPILGKEVLLKHEQGRGVATFISPLHEENATLTIHGDEAFFSRRLKDWLTKHLREVIIPQAEQACKALGVKYSRIQIRHVVQQWGSCSTHGTLSFAFHLIFASPEQLNYIICHEVAHLKEMNHGPHFWKLVEQLCPDYKKHRKWLKTHGHELQEINI